uniref:Uncharacterized protein n=1 Tax=Staphylococcus phage UHP46 TaxID=3234966 RepID=A0AB39C8E2_9CAUD
MMDKDIKQAIEKRKQYLDSQKVFKSPGKAQWEIYKNERNIKPKNFNDSEYSEMIICLLAILGALSFGVSIISFIWVGFMFGLLSLLAVGLVFAVAYYLTEGLPKFMKLPTQDNKFMSLGEDSFNDYRLSDYKRLHKLIYVKGEFYRVWYVRYVLGLDENEFTASDSINLMLRGNYSQYGGTTYLHRGISHGIPYVEEVSSEPEEEVDEGELDRVRNLLMDADRDREHWLNSLTTTRFLDYDEFLHILDTEKAVEEAKELDSKVSQFEEYMKNKDKLNKKR